MHSHTFSVVLPVHNGEQYLAAALQSVLSQTVQDFRILVLENASQDRTVEIAESFGDPRISFVPSKQPLRIEENWARIVDLDLDEFVTFISHDDLLYPEFLEEITSLIDAEPDASLYQTGFHIIDGQGRHVRDIHIGPRREDVRHLVSATHLLERETGSVGFATRSHDFKAVGGFPSYPGLLFSDLILWYNLTARSFRVSSPRRLAAFRQHSHNATRTSDLCQYYEASCVYLDAVRQIVPPQSSAEAGEGSRFVRQMNSIKHRQVIEDLIIRGSPEDIAGYRTERTRLINMTSSTADLNPFDFAVRVYEVIAAIPFQPARRLALYVLSLLLSVIRQLRALARTAR